MQYTSFLKDEQKKILKEQGAIYYDKIFAAKDIMVFLESLLAPALAD